jgi:hypothetical protein
MSDEDFNKQLLKLGCDMVKVLEQIERGQFDQEKALLTLNNLRLLLHKNQIDYNNFV